MTQETPRIYIADLAAYNAGYLHGAWIDATQEIEDIQAAIAVIFAASPVLDAEEYAIHDYENFQGYEVGEYASLQKVQAIARFIEKHGALGGKLLEHYCGSIEQATQALEEAYCGVYRSLVDFAQEITEETTTIPAALASYIDYAAIARDMDYNGDVFAIETGFEEVHIFWNH